MTNKKSNDSQIRAEIAQRLGYRIQPTFKKDAMEIAESFRRGGDSATAKEIEAEQNAAPNERPSKEELEAWDKECREHGIPRGAAGEREDEDYRILSVAEGQEAWSVEQESLTDAQPGGLDISASDWCGVAPVDNAGRGFLCRLDGIPELYACFGYPNNRTFGRPKSTLPQISLTI
ncbi:hypothetical protein J7T55_004208 [Diaporthe amygdali]|uniref:uncharacterized protein n=1 Tax=Phomopsis amygdali TaxID=1214568 RepID=UPI0022FF250A|nr:uncharacterized protein J7T55_004208 [Diaporthe amygdali]KAJ0103805.1 hypothetical protein J7T55_004208 [Diaporthe amygdali]